MTLCLYKIIKYIICRYYVNKNNIIYIFKYNKTNNVVNFVLGNVEYLNNYWLVKIIDNLILIKYLHKIMLN